ncbi:serine hydrolase domain-containing protein [Labrys sp. KB_33_2]|uniref:serine hydrolase domain-containing protein n=1 Tax=Labrys sp. KB_33_2 TaxID=3237479 RepID=UPI003F93F0B1
MRPHSLSVALAIILTGMTTAGLSGSAAAQSTCGTPGKGTSGKGTSDWPIAAPEDVGLDPQNLCTLAQKLDAAKEDNIHALLIARHGKLVFERYFTGSDSHWGQPAKEVAFGPDVPHDLRSISKSVVSLLFGIALDKGWIGSIDQPVLVVLPVYADLATPEKRGITLRHLLTMSPGLAWNEQLAYDNPANSESRMDMAKDPCRYALEQPVAHDPGLVWTYSGGTTGLLACVLQQATGKPLDELARENLFEPMGITKVEWARYPQNGGPVAASGLRLLPADTLKFGQLVLDKGAWKGRQIVSAKWIEMATAPQINAPGAMFYGFQFWLGRSLVDHRSVDWIAGFGYGGQRLFIVPSLDLTVMVHAGRYGGQDEGGFAAAILNRYVLPAAKP